VKWDLRPERISEKNVKETKLRGFTPRNWKCYEIVSIICDYLEHFRVNLYERFIDPYIALLILNYVGTM